MLKLTKCSHIAFKCMNCNVYMFAPSGISDGHACPMCGGGLMIAGAAIAMSQNRPRGLTIEIDANTTALEKALDRVEKRIDRIIDKTNRF